jgi:hypothetical protein
MPNQEGKNAGGEFALPWASRQKVVELCYNALIPELGSTFK